MTPTQFANFSKGAVELARMATRLGMPDIADQIRKRITIEAGKAIEVKPRVRKAKVPRSIQIDNVEHIS